VLATWLLALAQTGEALVCDGMQGPVDEGWIEIQELELLARIGVPDAERDEPQRLTMSMTLWPLAGFAGLNDDIAEAVDYAVVCREVKELVSHREDRLIETLASATADFLLRSYRLKRVRIELRKFILPDTKHVAVVVLRDRRGEQ
jgi:dihydroneopterin aldolase